MISVCVATYNGERYILEQLKSILSQIGPGDEVIISDDQSTDSTLSIVEQIGDRRIRLISHQRYKGRFLIDRSTHNFENALLASKGDIIFLSDQDDVWLPGKVRLMTMALSNADIVQCDRAAVDGDLQYLEPPSAAHPFSTSLTRNIISSSFLGCCMAMRRGVVEASLPMPRYGVAHDLWIGMVGVKHFRAVFLPETLVLYRRHEATVTANGKRNNTSLWFKIHYRLYVIRAAIRVAFNI